MHVIAPELAFLHIGSREFSVLGWFVEAFYEPFLLLMARHMEEEFEDDCSLSGKIVFELSDISEVLIPNLLADDPPAL
jgi:hypothetical protein